MFRAVIPADVVEAKQRRADHGPGVDDTRNRARREGGEPFPDHAEQQLVPCFQHAAAQHDRCAVRRQADPLHRRRRHHADLLGLAVEDVAGDRVARVRDRQQHPGQREQVVTSEPPLVYRHRDVGRALEAEVVRHRRSQGGFRAASVLGAHRVPDRLGAEARAAAPVAGQRAEREVAGDLPVWPDRHAVDPGAAGHGGPPRRLAAVGPQPRAQHRERVIERDRGL